MPRLAPVALLLLCIGILHASPVAESEEPGILERVVVMGASASAGYGTGTEIRKYGEDVPLSDLLRAMIASKEAQVIDAADALFFIAPESTGTEMTTKVKAQKPTCVIAIDFLFWFAYGNLESLELRRNLLEKGLKSLEDFECTLLISELPDVHRAIGAKVSKKQVPDRAMLDALNERIMEWAKPRRNVLVVPLKEKLADLYDDRTVSVGKMSWKPPEAISTLLQKDKLHPTITGLGMMAALSLETLLAKKLVSESDVNLDPKAARSEVIDARKKANR